jgi:hypothetical protein
MVGHAPWFGEKGSNGEEDDEASEEEVGKTDSPRLKGYRSAWMGR